MDIISNYIPEKVKKALADKEIVRDLDLILTELEKALNNAARDPATDSKLRTAFNDSARVLDVADSYVKNGKVSAFTLLKLAKDKGRLEQSGQILSDAFNAGNPAVNGIITSLQNNVQVQEAFKRIAVKTDGELFSLEKSADGQHYGIELVTGKNMKIPLTEKDYNEVKEYLDAHKPQQPPAPPANPPQLPPPLPPTLRPPQQPPGPWA